MKRKPKKSYKQLRSAADKLCYQIYLKEECEVCGKKAVYLHHFWYKRNYPHLRFDPDNLISLCISCHPALHFQDPKKIESKIIEKRGKKWYKKLSKMVQNRPEGSYLTKKWYEEQIKKLEKRKKIDQ